jgi:PAS domain S-box-containing protein
MRSVLRALRPPDIGVALYSAVYFAWLFLHTPGTPNAALVGGVAFYPVGLIVAWGYWKTSRLPGLDTRTRAAWMMLVLSAFLLSISGTSWDLYLHTVGRESYPGWVDHLEVAASVAAVAGYLLFPGRPFSGRIRTRLLLDMSLVVVAGSAVAGYFGGRLWLADRSQQSLWTAFQGPGLDWFVLVFAAVGTVTKRDAATRRAFGPLVLSGVLYVIANYFYTIGFDGHAMAQYQSGDTVDSLWFAAWVCRWLAARWPWYSLTAHAALPSPAGDAASASDEGGNVPYLVVAGCFVLLTTQAFSADPSFGLLAVSAAVTTVLMMLRHLVELRENRRLLDEQAAQETRFRSLVEHSSDAVLILDDRGVVTYASATASTVFGSAGVPTMGTRLADLVREDDRALVSKAVGSRGGSGRLLLHVRGSGDGWRELEAVWTDRRDDPAVEGILVNSRDVTHHRELERQLRHAQKLDAVGQLAGGLAHDINNSLAIVRGYAELLREELPPGSPMASDLSNVQLAVDRAAGITRKVLAFSRRQVAQPVVLDLSSVVADLLPLLRQSVAPQVEVRLELERQLWAIRADRGQLEQILVNLATNARDAMPDGGVLTFVTANRRLEATDGPPPGLSPGDYVSLLVRDQGAGMTGAVRSRIFEPFFSTKAATGGMGLGLAMVHDIMRASHGRIDVESAPGQGTTFSILLPRTFAPVAVQPGRPRAAASAPGRTVLLVDDEEKVRAVARRMLERSGYTVLEALDGAEALGMLGDPKVAIDVLLTDLVMPGVDGRQLIARCALERPGTPVVCMTGFAGELDAPVDLVGRRVAILSKPFSRETLLEALNARAARSATP